MVLYAYAMRALLGIEQRHVRYAVAYALLASANVLFVVLLRHMISDDDPCFYDEN
jgi:HEAT repeat protein